MKSKQILFFLTRTDLEPIMKSLEETIPIKYCEMGLFDFKESSLYSSVFEIENLGFPTVGDWVRDLRVIAISNKDNVVVREVAQRKGGFKYAIDPLVNQSSVCFQFGGIYEKGILVAGSCGTAFLNDFSLSLFNYFSKYLKKYSRRIGAFYVGPEAEERLRAGWRLVTDEKSPKRYDLVLS